MKISTQIKGQNNSFKKRQLDDAYWAMKNPEKIESKTDRRYIEQLIKVKPDWEKDEDFVHRLKQDTIKARMRGELKYKWHEFDIPPLSIIAMNLILLTIGLPYFIKNPKAFTEAKPWDKFVFSLGAVITPYSSIDALKYIFTGKNLFEKGDNTTINKTSKNQTK
jgi:hypothetical protein